MTGTRGRKPPSALRDGAGQKKTQEALAKAQELARAGQLREAVAALEQHAAAAPKPATKARLLAAAAQYLRGADRKRALELAEQATTVDPASGPAWMVLAILRDDRRDRKGSVAAALRALQTKLTPGERVEAGRHLSRLGEDRLALAAVTQGYKESGEAIELASFTLRVALQCADWALAGRITPRLRELHAQGRTAEAAETPRTHLLWCADEATNVKVISHFAARTFAAHPPLAPAARPLEDKRKLRVGYLSYDYRDHATTLLAMGMMRHHDRERFEWYGYCTSYDDGSAIRREILSRFDVARSFAHANDRRAAEQIVADKIDVLVDLNGLTEGTRHGILAWRPAPVQISYLGFPGTAGGRYIDYIIADPYTVPEGMEALYPEAVIRIPPTYQINDYAARWLPPQPRRAALNLPEGCLIVGMFNNVNKVGAEVWAAWMRILVAVPRAVLWMLDPGELAREHLLRATVAAGVDAGRVVFAPKMRQEAHMARLQHCDLVLDPWPYGGHTTTGDALFAAVPVVALQGTNFASRVSGGLLVAAGMSKLVRPDVAAYEQAAISLLNSPDDVAAIKHHLRQRRTSLPAFDAALRTRQLEVAYQTAHAHALTGKPPEHFAVNVSRSKGSP